MTRSFRCKQQKRIMILRLEWLELIKIRWLEFTENEDKNKYSIDNSKNIAHNIKTL